MSNLVDQRTCLKFCVSNEISCAEALKMLKKTYGDTTMSKTQAYEWYKEFKAGRSVVDDLPRCGRPSTSLNDENVQKVKKMLQKNRRMRIREIAAVLGVSFGSVQSIMHDVLGMRRAEGTHRARAQGVQRKTATSRKGEARDGVGAAAPAADVCAVNGVSGDLQLPAT